MESKTTRTTSLEPRVAKLETGLELLTRDVASLAQVVRDQGGSIETQIRELAVSVTQAAAPRKTDWQVIISLGLLMMSLGSAVFFPINSALNQTQKHLEQMGVELQNTTIANKVLEERVANLKGSISDANKGSGGVLVPLPFGLDGGLRK